MSHIDRRWAAIIGGYLALGIAGALVLWGTTQAGADLGTYQRAAHDLWTTGDPYATAAQVPADYVYRYPPLLAMLIPVVGWPPLWYAIVAGCTAFPIWLAYRQAGPVGLLPAALLVGPWGQQLVNGNAQAILVTLLALVPLHRRAGAVGLAVATMLKLHPALAIAWYVGRRDWGAIGWFLAACGALLLVQLPWLDDFVRFYATNPAATDTVAGMSLRVLGVVPWAIGTGLVTIAAVWLARSRWGWMLAIVLQLVALPRVLLVNLALLLAAPLPSRTRPDRRDGGA